MDNKFPLSTLFLSKKYTYNNNNSIKNNKIQFQQFCYYFYNPFLFLSGRCSIYFHFFDLQNTQIHTYTETKEEIKELYSYFGAFVKESVWTKSNLRITELIILINYNF